MKDVDLVIEEPLTGERASVQVKSTADQRVLDACVATFSNSASANDFFFICHSSPGPLVAPAVANRTVHIWTVEQLAAQAVDQGLAHGQGGLAVASVPEGALRVATGQYTPCISQGTKIGPQTLDERREGGRRCRIGRPHNQGVVRILD